MLIKEKMIKNTNNEVNRRIIFNTIMFILMILVNLIADFISLDGIKATQILSINPALFSPANYTYFIWSFIFIGLGAFTIYQYKAFNGKNKKLGAVIMDISIFFVISAIGQIGWVFALHWNNIPLTVVHLIFIIIALIITYTRINNSELPKKDERFFKIPFSIFFAWVTSMFLVNISVWLQNIGWTGCSMSEQTWTILATLLLFIIGVTITYVFNDVAYGSTILWALVGILVKHISKSGFAGQYIWIIACLVISIILMSFTIARILYRNKIFDVCSARKADI